MKIIVMLGLIFVWNVQPYIIIIRLIIITLGYSIFIYIRIRRYWYRYILILVILRGVLVLFRYIASLIPNEKFEYIKLLYVRVFIYLILIIGFNQISIYWGDTRLLLFKMWNILINLYNLYLVLFLIRIIIMVVWLRNCDSGAIRNY